MPLASAVESWPLHQRSAFVSYAREAVSAARHVAAVLEGAGVRVWVDEQRISAAHPDAVVSERIWDAVAVVTDFVAILTADAVRKPWVRHEWQVAATRWLASGSPRVHIVVVDQNTDLPRVPHASVTQYGDDDSLVRALTADVLGDDAPTDDAEWTRVIDAIKLSHRIGGTAATAAVHTFETVWPTLQLRLAAAWAAGFRGRHAPLAGWLVRLGPQVDLRVPRTWLVGCLTAAYRSYDVAPNLRATLCNNLGVALCYGGRWDAARQHLAEARELCRDLDDLPGELLAVGNLALIALERGAATDAATPIAEAYALVAHARRRGLDGTARYEVDIAECLLQSHEGWLLTALGDYGAAFRRFSEHLISAEVIENRRLIAAALGRLAWLEICSGVTSDRTAVALRRYEELSVALLNPRGAANAAAWQGQLAMVEQRHAEALGWFRREATLRQMRDEPADRCRALAWGLLAAGELGDRAASVKLRHDLACAYQDVALEAADRAFVARAIAYGPLMEQREIQLYPAHVSH